MGAGLLAERTKGEGWAAICTSVDIFKAFGQVNRLALFAVLSLSGMPTAAVSAYARFIHGLELFNSFAA
eukprot:2168358-Alexandrium_andersonii.AAC.1